MRDKEQVEAERLEAVAEFERRLEALFEWSILDRFDKATNERMMRKVAAAVITAACRVAWKRGKQGHGKST